MDCECGCGEILTGRQKRFKSDDHRARYWSNCRKAGALGKGLDSLLPGRKNKAHFVTVIGNNRLEPLMLELQRRKVMTSLELQRITGSMCIATDMSNIRKFYPQVSAARQIGKTEAGRKIYQYEWL